MQKRIIIAAIAAALSLPLALNAADENKKKGGGFVAADTDKDGKVTEAEYVAALSGRLDAAAAKARFAKIDADKDGSLTRQEFSAGVGEKKGADKDGNAGEKKGKKKTEN